MRIIVFGSTGSIGSVLVKQALDRGHDVTAFTRNPEKVSTRHQNFAILHGDVQNAKAVEAAVYDKDAVFVTLGDGRKGNVRFAGTANVVRAMEHSGVRRLICQTTLGVGESVGNLNFFWRYVMFGWFLKEAFEDHVQQERVVIESRLDWTIVRPAAFTDGPLTGRYRHGFSCLDKNLTLKVSRMDVAHFLLDQLDTDAYLRKTPGLSY